MSGIGLVLNVAKDALLTNQYALDVVAHNIANVSTEGYSRQSPVLDAQRAAPYAGFTFGRGVELEAIVRNTNSFLEKRLHNGQSELSSMTAKNTYMDVMEAVFDENSGRSLSSQLTDFWNAWNDLSNNPSGTSERNLLSEYGTLLSQSFNDLNSDLMKMDQEIDTSIEAGIEKINSIISELADINGQVLVVEVNGNANDLRDKRNNLVTELSKYLDINYFELDDGNLTVSTGKGNALVNRNSYYPVSFDGTDIIWQSSGGASIAISDSIEKGQIGGWLDIRDENILKYKNDLNELAKSMIWEVNKLHSQGVGSSGFSTVTGTYSATDSTAAMGTTSSGLDFYDQITDGSLKLWVYDSAGAVDSTTSIPILSGSTTLDGLLSTINGISNLSVTKSNGKIQIASATNYTFGFSDDTSNILAALGVNSFFEGSGSLNIAVNDKILTDKNNVAASKINSNVGPAVGASTNVSTGILTTGGPYTGSNNATYNVEITTTGNQGAAVFRWNKDGGAWTSGVTAGSGLTLSDGVTITLTTGTYTDNDTFTIDVTETNNTYGSFAPGDNSNALDVADLQNAGVTIKRWTYERGSAATSQDITGRTLDEYHHVLVGTIGIASQSVKREMDYKSTIMTNLQETRDNISSVSLDEEMTELIKYQHAFAAAAKLITTADEMLEILLATK